MFPRKVLTAAEMREVDRRTMESGLPGVVLMENAGMRVVEYLAEKFSPLSEHRVVVFCGKGNNGGDGLVIARQLYTRFRLKALHVVLAGEGTPNLEMLTACGCPFEREITMPMRAASIVIDALLGTGVRGPATGPALDAIREINTGFPLAKVVAVDIPSGLPSDTNEMPRDYVRADHTVTFTALKVSQALAPTCTSMGQLRIAPIGTPPAIFQDDANIRMALITPPAFRHLLAPRAPDSNKGTFGHALIWAGSHGKTGAAAMAGMAALRAGAGLVTVASEESALAAISSHSPELMTVPVEDAEFGRFSVIAMGPGLGQSEQTAERVRRLFAECERPMVVDADALNALAGAEWSGAGKLRVLTPHPGEMGRLSGKSVAEIQHERVNAARDFARERQIALVLKGERTLLAFPDGRVWINPTGSPAMATGGTGDILTGMITGFLAQFPKEAEIAVAAAVYLHGLCGELAARALGDKAVIATDLLKFLPDALHECANVSDEF